MCTYSDTLTHTHTHAHTQRCFTFEASLSQGVGLGSCGKTWNCRHLLCYTVEGERGGGRMSGEGRGGVGREGSGQRRGAGKRGERRSGKGMIDKKDGEILFDHSVDDGESVNLILHYHTSPHPTLLSQSILTIYCTSS